MTIMDFYSYNPIKHCAVFIRSTGPRDCKNCTLGKFIESVCPNAVNAKGDNVFQTQFGL